MDTDNLTDCSSAETPKTKRKLSTSTDGDSTNYELIEYLKRREKRDEELLRRMDAREERLLNLLERTVVAIEALTQQSRCTHSQPTLQSQSQKTDTETEVKLVNGSVKTPTKPTTNTTTSGSSNSTSDDETSEKA